MTNKQKYLVGVAVISLILGGIWYGIASMMGKGEPKKEAPPSALNNPQPSSSEDTSPEPDEPSKHPDEVDPKEALKTAKEFLRAYLSFNGKNPTKHSHNKNTSIKRIETRSASSRTTSRMRRHNKNTSIKNA